MMKINNGIKAMIFFFLISVSFQGYGQHVRKGMGGKPSSEIKVNKLTLFPNPASKLVDVSLGTKEKKENFALEVFNSSGTNVVKQSWNGEKLDVSQFPSGIYIVTLRKNKLVYSQKLVVARE